LNTHSPRSRRTIFVLAGAVSAMMTGSRARGLNIVPEYSSSVTGLSNFPQIESAVNYVVQQYDGLFSNNATLDIDVETMTSGLSASRQHYFFPTTYSQVYDALAGLDSSSDQITAGMNLPATDPTGAGSTWLLPGAEAEVLGLASITPGDAVGTFYFNDTLSYDFDPYNRAVTGEYDFIGDCEHEFSEVMGRIFGGGPTDYVPLDLYRFSAPGVRNLTAANNLYFSYDGGQTPLKYYNYPDGNGSDPQDWASGTPDSYNAFADPDQNLSLSDADVSVMHILGYNASPTTLTFSDTGVLPDFLTGGAWSTSTQTGINPHHGAYLLLNTDAATIHSFTSGENMELGDMSDTGQVLEISDGVLALDSQGTPSGPGYGLLINQNGALDVDNHGQLTVEAGPLSIGDAAGVTNASASFDGSGRVIIGTTPGASPGLFVGNSGTGSVLQYGNALVQTPLLDLGTTSSGAGNYSLAGTASIKVATYETVGDAGTGTFTQSGGTQSITGTLSIANGPLSSGEFILSAGDLTGAAEIVGVAGSGAFAQSGGTQTISGDLILGNALGSSGVMNAAGGVTQVDGSAYIGGNASGRAGSGVLDIGGASLTVNGALTVYNPNYVNFTSGSLTVGSLNTGGQSHNDFNWSGGTLHLTAQRLDFIATFPDPYNDNPLGNAPLNLVDGQGLIVDSTEWLPDSGDRLTQNDGSSNACNYLYVGSSGVAATYNLDGGTLTTANIDNIGYNDSTYNIGGSGIFNQVGGTLTTQILNVGFNQPGTFSLGFSAVADVNLLDVGTIPSGNGTFSLSGAASLNASGNEVVGDYGTGTFNQSGGTQAISGTLDIGNQTVGVGAYTLSSGAMSVDSEVVGNAGAGTFVQSGGTQTISNNLIIGAQTTATGGMTLNSGSTQVSGNAYVGGNASGQAGIGVLTVQGGSLAVTGTLQTYSEAPAGINLSSGTINVGTLSAAGSTTMSGGTFIAAAVSNNGAFSETNGSVRFGPVTGNGTIVIGGGSLALMTVGGLTQNALTINPNAVLELKGGADNTLNHLTITGIGEFDLNNYHLFIDYAAGSDPISTIAAYIRSGYSGGSWSGPGIISSSAVNPTNGHRYGIGFADGADKIVSGLTSGQIELKYTLLGDANLDGVVNGSDFSILAANFGLGHTNWDQGNFLFSSSVNGSDFSALAANFGQGDSGAAIAVSQADIDALDAFAVANGLPLPEISSVPEPAFGAIMLINVCLALPRRRRTSKRAI
jgi:hypothetical protein